jgi:hypothetical protein
VAVGVLQVFLAAQAAGEEIEAAELVPAQLVKEILVVSLQTVLKAQAEEVAEVLAQKECADAVSITRHSLVLAVMVAWENNFLLQVPQFITQAVVAVVVVFPGVLQDLVV